MSNTEEIDQVEKTENNDQMIEKIASNEEEIVDKIGKEEMHKKVRSDFLSQKISVCIKLNKNDIAGFSSPSPYYVIIFFDNC